MSKRSTTASVIINHLKSIFANYGNPELVVSGNGPQFKAEEFSIIATDYGFTHVTSSPKFPQANGKVEWTIQTVKNMLEKEEDRYKALIAYRSTPMENGYSPAELLMGRRIHSTVPTPPGQVIPKWSYLNKFREAYKNLKARQKQNFDVRHKVKDIPELHMGDKVCVSDIKKRGVIRAREHTSRSYIVETPAGELRRNRRDL